MIDGPARKGAIEEGLGDGVVSATDFYSECMPHPEGDRARVSMPGKFLPNGYRGTGQGLPGYDLGEG